MADFPDGAPNLNELVACVLRVAHAMGQRPPTRESADSFIRKLLYDERESGGREVYACLAARIITEIEAKHLVMAHVATWLLFVYDLAEPDSNDWSSPDLELAFELALFGRPAIRST